MRGVRPKAPGVREIQELYDDFVRRLMASRAQTEVEIGRGMSPVSNAYNTNHNSMLSSIEPSLIEAKPGQKKRASLK